MEWKAQLGEPTVNQMVSGGRRKLHYLYPDNTEMVEELDVTSSEVLLRKWKRPKQFGEAEWDFEIGQPMQVNFDPSSDLLAPSNQNPIFMRKDSETHFEWRIRNLTYPKEVYSVGIDHVKQEIVLKTTNKKYYKRFDIADMRRLQITLEDKYLQWKHQNNTVLIGYEKPDKILELEKQKRS